MEDVRPSQEMAATGALHSPSRKTCKVGIERCPSEAQRQTGSKQTLRAPRAGSWLEIGLTSKVKSGLDFLARQQGRADVPACLRYNSLPHTHRDPSRKNVPALVSCVAVAQPLGTLGPHAYRSCGCQPNRAVAALSRPPSSSSHSAGKLFCCTPVQR